MRFERVFAAALDGGVALAAFATAWWMIGDLSERGRASTLDYVVKAPAVDARAVALLVVAGCACAVLLLTRVANDRDRIALVSVVGTSVAAGVVVAYGARIVTAGSHGANVGASFACVAILPFGIGLFALSFVRLARTLSARHVGVLP